MTARTLWFIAKTKHNRERYAMRNLVRAASQYNIPCNVFAPVIECNYKGKEEFLFPGFVFVNTPGQWRFIENTYGCYGVVTFGESAGTIPHRVIRQLRQIEKAKRLPKLRKAKPGEIVKVLDGPYRDLTGLYQGVSKTKRVCILLDFMSKQVPLELDARHIAPVAA